ncbi:MAG TPA: T9SS type B sorting domain-containing protein [Chitinophagaceae bacterium]
MIVDSGGDIFFCGYQNLPGSFDGRIYKVKKTPTGYDPNPVLIASGLGGVWDLVMDQNRNLFCLDSYNGKIFKISYTGGGNYSSIPVSITTIPSPNCMGLAINKTNGNLYFVHNVSGNIYEIANTGGVYSTTPIVIATGIGSLSDITIDNAENLYIVSEFYGKLHSLSKVNGVYSTVPSLLVSGLSHPTGITIDNCGNLFICNQGNFTITEIVKTGNTYNPSPVFITSGIIYPQGIAVDREGNLFSNNTTVADIYFVKKNNPQVSISTPTLQVCANSNVVFTASVSNTGVETFQYQWKKNGIDVGANTPAYSDNALNNNDIISCDLIGISSCFVETSDSLQMLITTSQPLSILINSNVTSVCMGATVLFNAITPAPNNSTSFQWKKNGVNVGTNTTTYSDNNLNNGDIINCVLTSRSNCLLTTTANSNSIVITLLPKPVVSLDKSTSLCTDGTRQLDAGNFKTYLWSDGSVQRTLSINNFGTYYVTVTDNNGCTASDTAKITTLLPSPAAFLPPDTSICLFENLELGSLRPYNGYLWNTNSAAPSISITSPGLYWLEVLDNNNCKGRDSILVNPKQCMTGFYIPSGFTPNSDGKNDKFRPLLSGNIKLYKFTIYNRWGQVVFQTTEISKGWDGTFSGNNQDSNVFIWKCTYQLEGEKTKMEKGTVMLIR